MPETKPPIELAPKNIWKSVRLHELKEAIIRYLDAGLEVPSEWLKEYNEMVNTISN